MPRRTPTTRSSSARRSVAVLTAVAAAAVVTTPAITQDRPGTPLVTSSPPASVPSMVVTPVVAPSAPHPEPGPARVELPPGVSPAVAGGSCEALDSAGSVAAQVGRVFEHEQVAGAAGVATAADGAVVLRLDEPGGDVVVSTDGVVPIDEATYFELKTPVMWEPWVRLEVDGTGLRCEQRLPGGA